MTWTYLMQGDCLERMKEIPDDYVDMVLCDLPYGTTQCKWDTVIDPVRMWKEYKRICTGAIVLTAAQPFTSVLVCSNLKDFKYQWVWEKEQGTGFLNAKKMPLKSVEDVLIFGRTTYNPQMTVGNAYSARSKGRVMESKSAGTHSECYGAQKRRDDNDNTGLRYPTQVLRIQRERGLHPTQKPVALMEYMVKTYTNEGMTVLDNCIRSGTTGVACVNTNRNFIGIEQDEAYYNIAVKRIEDAKIRPIEAVWV